MKRRDSTCHDTSGHLACTTHAVRPSPTLVTRTLPIACGAGWASDGAHPINESDMRRYCSAIILTAFLTFALHAQTLHAQTLREQTRSLAEDTTSGPSRIVSINPFILLFGYFSGEYEKRVSSTLSVAVAGSYIKFDSDRYTNLDVKARLYPNELAMRGFGIATSLGATAIRSSNTDCVFAPTPSEPTCTTKVKTFTSPAVAIELQYQWLLGSRKHTAVTLGGGLKRFLGSSAKFDQSSVSRFLPTGRVSIGYAY